MDAYYPGPGTEISIFVYLGLSVATSLLFFISILCHELGHSFAAGKCGVTVSSITLHLFGGVARMDEQPQTPKKEFFISIMGPVVSLTIGGIGLALAFFSMGKVFYLIPNLLLWLGYVNVITALFNLLPGFPMDGGRVLRAVIWSKTGNETKATRITCKVGMAFAVIVGLVGIYFMIIQSFSLGIWAFIIAWFFYGASKETLDEMKTRRDYSMYPLSKHLNHDYQVFMALDSIGFVNKKLSKVNGNIPILVSKDNGIIGILEKKDLDVAAVQGTDIRLGSIMHPLQDYFVPISADPLTALDVMNRQCTDNIAVIDGNKLLGFVSRKELSEIQGSV